MSFLELHSLTKRFGGLLAIDHFSLSLEKGSLTALVGPNGCGKSTLFNLITGALGSDSGKIYLLGDDITGLPAHEIAKRGVGRKFQVPSIFSELTVRQNLLVPTLQGRLFRRAKSSPEILDQILEQIKLTEKADNVSGTLSHGEKQWLEIGMVLAQSPSLILLDEPTAGMTVAETAATADLIKSINQNQDVTLLVIEHDIGFIEQLDCPLTVMSKGQILKSGTFASIRSDPEVQELYFGRTEKKSA